MSETRELTAEQVREAVVYVLARCSPWMADDEVSASEIVERLFPKPKWVADYDGDEECWWVQQGNWADIRCGHKEAAERIARLLNEDEGLT